MNWRKLIDERNEWIAHNFPDHILGEYPNGCSIETVFGVLEELGELTHSYIKEGQSIRGTAEEHQAAAKNAIGDMTVYLLGIMAQVGPPELKPVHLRAESTQQTIKYMAVSCGKLMTNPDRFNVENLVYYMQKYCRLRGWSYTSIVHETWAEVKARDWVKYPDTGRAEPSLADRMGDSPEQRIMDELHD